MAALQLPAERPGHPAPPEIVERRRIMSAAIAAGTWRINAPQRTANLNGVRVLRVSPPDRAPHGTIVHLHGGGYRIGCPEMVGPFAAALAARCGVDVVSPEYRLAPEHPFPAGLADTYSVMRALQEAGENPLILSGDSAGGGLAAALTAISVAEAKPPTGLVLLSPWLDLTVTNRSYDENAAADPLFSRNEALKAATLYLQGMSPQHPLASPLFGTVKGFPPALISVGLEEVLCGDAHLFHAKLLAAGAAAHLLAISGMQHVAVTRSFSLPGAFETFEAVANFLDGLMKVHAE
jgi:acetyl esterase/lipase